MLLFRCTAYFLLLLSLSSCADFTRLSSVNAETILKKVKRGDNLRLKVVSHQKLEIINKLSVTEISGDSLLVGVERLTHGIDAPRKVKISEITEISWGSKDPAVSRTYIGYNSFNEVFAGVQTIKQADHKFNLELGYQFALSKSATYSDVANPILTTNASGLRVRAGYQFLDGRWGQLGLIQLEYQDLQSNEFNMYSSASSFATYYLFKESYKKYGIRYTKGIQIMDSNVFFTYSVAIFHMDVVRIYSYEGIGSMSSSGRQEYFHRPTVQLSLGLRIYMW